MARWGNFYLVVYWRYKEGAATPFVRLHKTPRDLRSRRRADLRADRVPSRRCTEGNLSVVMSLWSICTLLSSLIGAAAAAEMMRAAAAAEMMRATTTIFELIILMPKVPEILTTLILPVLSTLILPVLSLGLWLWLWFSFLFCSMEMVLVLVLGHKLLTRVRHKLLARVPRLEIPQHFNKRSEVEWGRMG